MFEHVWNLDFQSVPDTLEIDADDAIEILVRGVLHGPEPTLGSSIVDGDVNAAKALDALGERGSNLL